MRLPSSTRAQSEAHATAMEELRAQMAAETDGIFENAPAKRQKVCAIFMLHSHSRFK